MNRYDDPKTYAYGASEQASDKANPGQPCGTPIDPPFDLAADLANIRALVFSSEFGAAADKTNLEDVQNLNARFDITEVVTRDITHYWQLISLVAMLSLTQDGFFDDVAAERNAQESLALENLLRGVLRLRS